jgi:hypothetical protein
VHDTSDFTHAIHSRSGGSVTVAVLRDKKEQILTITLPERKDSGEMIDESLEAPEADEETQMEVSEAQNLVARLRPQMELAREESRKASEETLKALCGQQKEMKEQSEKLQLEIQPRIQDELQKSGERLQQQLKLLRYQRAPGSFDI